MKIEHKKVIDILDQLLFQANRIKNMPHDPEQQNELNELCATISTIMGTLRIIYKEDENET